MSKPLKPRRGTTAENNAFVGEAYEVTYDTDKNTLVCRDGLNAGGFPLAQEGDVSNLDTALRALIAKEVGEAESKVSSLETTLRALIAAELAKKLSTIGGNLTGSLTFGNIGALYHSNSSTTESMNIGLKEGAVGRSAVLSLRSARATDAPGSFWLGARSDSAGDKYLVGRTEGSLDWMGQRVLRGVDVYAQFFSDSLSGVTIPAGGTWGVFILGRLNTSTWVGGGDLAGGTYVNFGSTLANAFVFAVRKA